MKTHKTMRGSMVWLGVALVVGLAVPCAMAKTTAATSNGDWSGAIWNNGAPAAGDDVAINAGVTVTVSSAVGYFSSFTNNGTLVFTNWDTSLSATNIGLTGGTVTHALVDVIAAPGVTNRVYFICSNMTLAASATIDAYGKGFKGGPWVPDGSSSVGQGPGANTDESSQYQSAPAHGGDGRVAGGGVPYGDPYAPITPGSGGGHATSQASPQWPGGNGGGVVRIWATGTVIIDGTIRADGHWSQYPQPSFSQGSNPGSGGSIYITCRTLGGSGLLNARGGNGTLYRSGAGGGRIAVVFDPASQSNAPASSVAFNVAGGLHGWSGGSPGTPGSLYVSDGTVLSGGVWSNGAVLYVGSGQWTIPADLTVKGAELTLATACRLTVPGNFSVLASTNYTSWGYVLGALDLQAPTLAVAGDFLASNVTVNVRAAATNGTVAYGANCNVTGNMRLIGGATLYPCSDATNGGSVFFSAGSLTVDSTSQVNADALGFRGGAAGTAGPGYGPGKGQPGTHVTSSQYDAGGGGYGGVGHAAWWTAGTGGPTYGSSNAPTQPGSGGASRGVGYAGGAGGGLFWLQARRTVTLDGIVSANGTPQSTVTPAYNGFGGGSGGGIYIVCKGFAGGGTLRANGGTSCYGSGGGGGGRIAVWATTTNWTGSTSVSGGVGAGNEYGGTGTVVWQYVPPKGTSVIIQ